MATIRRAGFGTVFELEDSKVGIGTDAATHTLQALGNIRSEAATDIGISSLTTYQGFVDKEARFTTGQIDIESQSGATSGEIVIDGDVTVSSATTFTSGPQHLTVTDTFTVPSGDINSRALKPTPGSFRFNQDFATLEFYTGNNWATVNTFTEIRNSPGNRGRVLNFGGKNTAGNRVRDISSIHIMTFGNSESFGDLTDDRRQIGACSSEIRALTMGGSGPGGDVNEIAYHTIASEGNSIDFGNLQATKQTCSALSSSTRGITYGSGGSPYNQIDYVEIATLGDSIDFGDTAVASRIAPPACSPVRGFKTGGTDDSINRSEKEFITIASKGNGTVFGDAQVSGPGGGGASNSVRAVKMGGYDYVSPYPRYGDIEYFNMISLGESLDFGNMTGESVVAGGFGNAANQVRAVFTGGYRVGSTVTNAIDFLTFATTGNAQDFGDLASPTAQVANASDSHGGLGGF